MHTFMLFPERCAAAAAFSNTLFTAVATWPVSADIFVSLRTSIGVLSMSELLDLDKWAQHLQIEHACIPKQLQL
jgi:hypothetical protein